MSIYVERSPNHDGRWSPVLVLDHVVPGLSSSLGLAIAAAIVQFERTLDPVRVVLDRRTVFCARLDDRHRLEEWSADGQSWFDAREFLPIHQATEQLTKEHDERAH